MMLMYTHIMKRWVIGCSVILVVIIIASALYFLKISNKVENFSDGNKIVLVYSTSCTYCTLFKPVFERYALDHPKIKTEILDTTSHEASPYNSKITGFPATLVVNPENAVIAILVGNQSYENLDKFVKKQP